ncbi:MAG: hypothetical protein QM640_17550 [Niabella sp.]
MIRIRAFKAPNDEETCKKFIAGHRRILEMYYGIIKITSDNTEWTEDPYCIVIVAEDTESGKVYGGARVQLAGGKHKLPLESAISKYDKGVFNEVNQSYDEGGTCEICGLWNSKEIAGMGIGSRILSMVGVGISDQLNVKSIYALCAPGTLKITYRMGFTIVKSLGNEGTFLYPKDNFVATIMRLNNIYDLSFASDDERERILFYRNNIYGKSTERGPKGTYEVVFDLKV